jgi:hypothetical protein
VADQPPAGLELPHRGGPGRLAPGHDLPQPAPGGGPGGRAAGAAAGPVRAEFKAAVRQALRDYIRRPPAALAADPLLRSRLATQAPGGAPATAATLRAAERLGLPFSTYRYHPAGGLRRVTERLWRAELYGPDD